MKVGAAAAEVVVWQYAYEKRDARPVRLQASRQRKPGVTTRGDDERNRDEVRSKGSRGEDRQGRQIRENGRQTGESGCRNHQTTQKNRSCSNETRCQTPENTGKKQDRNERAEGCGNSIRGSAGKEGGTSRNARFREPFHGFQGEREGARQ